MTKAKKTRNYRATEATHINVAASKKRDASLAARVRRLEQRVADLARKLK
jgi:uncharacterized protein YceH (UPF0502 family)